MSIKLIFDKYENDIGFTYGQYNNKEYEILETIENIPIKYDRELEIFTWGIKKHKAPESIMRVLLRPTHLYPAPILELIKKTNVKSFWSIETYFDSSYNANLSWVCTYLSTMAVADTGHLPFMVQLQIQHDPRGRWITSQIT